MIPDKGRVLTGLSRYWFAETAGIVPNHLLDTDSRPRGYSCDGRGATPPTRTARRLRGRMMICRPATVVPIEAVVRGYLAGSGWKEYRATGARLRRRRCRAGLRESDRLPEPIFTPATKAETGEHDENIDFEAMVDRIVGVLGDGRRAGSSDPQRSLRSTGTRRRVAERRRASCSPTRSSSSGIDAGDGRASC